MSVTIDLTETDLFTALRGVLLQVLPTGTEVIRAQENRVPEPEADNYVIMNSAQRVRLSTNAETWDQTDPNPTTISARDAAQVMIQCDVHGPAGADNAWLIVTALRSSWGCQRFAEVNPAIQPLYVQDPTQVPFVNGEQQFEDRWNVDVVLQANANITFTQDFANQLAIGLIDVDARYPPP